jgi:tRNA G10  N-methylase Trm11
VDFEKPGSGMGIGMMPAKLALTMINIALAHHQANHKSEAAASPVEGEYTIYDPFCGFGTTGFLANAHGYHVICSDINGSLIKSNLAWRQTHARHTDHRFTAFKHDATDPITKPFVKHTDVIVTE